MQPLRIYIMGAGIAAIAHAAALQTLPANEITQLAVADPNQAALATFLQRYPHARSFSDVDAMLAEPANERDIVIVATPPFLHCELACAALQSGRHVLCEKPFALNIQEAREMMQTARTHNRVLGCCSSRALGSPVEDAMRALLAEDALGKIYHLRFLDCAQRYRPGIELQPESPWFLQRALSGGGVLANLGTYDITFLNDLLRPERVDVLAAWMANPIFVASSDQQVSNDVEQHIGATLRYHLPDTTTMMVTYERAAGMYGQPTVSMEIVGTRGAIQWDWFLWAEQVRLVYTTEENGQIVRQERLLPGNGAIPTMHKPLYYFYRHLNNFPSSALVNERALFHFSCVQALYQYILTNQTQSVSWDTLLAPVPENFNDQRHQHQSNYGNDHCTDYVKKT